MTGMRRAGYTLNQDRTICFGGPQAGNRQERNTMYYTVSEVAKRLELSPHTIRFYGKEGLLDFVERDQNGNRIFKEEDFERLFIIASLKRAGMSIKQIRAFTLLCDEGDATIARRLEIIRDQKKAVDSQIAVLQDALEVLQYKTWLYETALAAGTTAVHDTLPPEAMPPHIREVKECIRRLTGDMEARYKAAARPQDEDAPR